ncbi:MAG: hypothetical protein KJ064_10310 [Anaerolineae bacterium]|nr:hypothetical protein [Anaerolineae bacterium]
MSDYNDNNYGGRDEWRYGGESDDAWGAANAEDHYDEGTPYDMSMEQYAAGLERDPRYERPYMGSYAQPPQSNAYPPSTYGEGLSSPSEDLPPSAQYLRSRFVRRGYQIGQRQHGGSGIDGLFEMSFSSLLGRGIPCSPGLILLSAVILILACVVVSWLAANALSDILGL